MPGITGNGGLASKGVSERSSWTWRGSPLPCAPGGTRMPYAGIVRRLLAERQLDMRFVYERMLEGATEGSAIKVERLRAHGHPWEVERLAYKHASHIMVSLETGALKLFREEREHPRECAASRLDAFKRTLAFLERW